MPKINHILQFPIYQHSTINPFINLNIMSTYYQQIILDLIFFILHL